MKGNPFIKQRVMAVSIGLLILLVGFISLTTLPMDQYPDIAPPTVVVSASYDGADAKTAIKSVIQPLEEAINGVEDMYYMKSTATSTGNITILVFFKPGTNPDMAAVNVQNRVSMAQPLLPQEVLQFGVSVAKQQNNILQVFQLESPDGSYDPEFIANYLDIAVKPRLTRVTGVGKV
ncbi:MAG: efflux RND transporter permease subunit, partial [Bacteroidales bacterium]|nr:efflux RND transporter permease subunit [Bacteroidales bacterium]